MMARLMLVILFIFLIMFLRMGLSLFVVKRIGNVATGVIIGSQIFLIPLKKLKKRSIGLKQTQLLEIKRGK